MPDWNNELELFKVYKGDIKTFVETGSHEGDGIQKALDAGYENIISIELSEFYVDRCIERFLNEDNVKIVQGDSCDVLPPTINEIDESIVFWLDGHYSCGKTAKGKYWSPIMYELDAISKHPIKNHTIMIDDMRCWSRDNPEFRFGHLDIEEKIKSINSDYHFEYFRPESVALTKGDGAFPEGLLGDILVASIK